jgi:CRP-like cAMP-binding protein
MSFHGHHNNKLLARLSDRDRSELADRLQEVHLDNRQEIYAADQNIDDVYFPVTLVGSTVVNSNRSAALEVATTGNEGLIGFPAVLGVNRPVGRTVVQVDGTALRMSVIDLKSELKQRPHLNILLHLYIYALMRQIIQSGACIQFHPILPRCARWLLQMHDRAGRDTFRLTQQSLAEMMGVRRATVNPVLGQLKRNGLLDYVRGRMRIIDRVGLEKAACSCYLIIRNEYERLNHSGH